MNRCLSTYVPLDEEGYSPGALTRLSDRRVFPHRLDLTRPKISELRSETITRMSISGVQEKLSLRLQRGKLIPVAENGEYILKPVPAQALPRFAEEVPANESLTMQIAEQVFGIETAANACIRLADGELAYITRRFDRERGGTPIAQEDFCQLMERTPDTAGKNYKYDSSYEELARTLKRFCGAYAVESEKLFRIIVFNYGFANGDAHLKNFSLLRTSLGDYILSPAYDLLSTQLHLPHETRLALDLFADEEYSEGELSHGFVTGKDLLELGRRMGLIEHRAAAVLRDFLWHHTEVEALIDRSFLSPEAKAVYHAIIADRRRALILDVPPATLDTTTP